MKFLMRLRDVVEAVEPYGITKYLVKKAIKSGALKKIPLTDEKDRAHYSRADVVRVFGLEGAAGVVGNKEK